MDNYEKRRRARIRAAYRRLGTSTPACSVCGEDNPFCLEKHEPGGRKYTELYVIICRNCHRKLEDDRRDHFPPIWTPPDPAEILSKALQGEADLFERLAKKGERMRACCMSWRAKTSSYPTTTTNEAWTCIPAAAIR